MLSQPVPTAIGGWRDCEPRWPEEVTDAAHVSHLPARGVQLLRVPRSTRPPNVLRLEPVHRGRGGRASMEPGAAIFRSRTGEGAGRAVLWRRQGPGDGSACPQGRLLG